MQVLDRIAELSQKMYDVEHRDNSRYFPAKTCRDLQLCHSGIRLKDGEKGLHIPLKIWWLSFLHLWSKTILFSNVNSRQLR